MQPLRQKVRRKCDPLGRNTAESMSGRVKNATLRRKVEWDAGGTRVETDRKPSGPARAAGGRNSDFIRELQISAISLDLTRLEPRWGRRIYGLPPLPPTHRGIVCVGSGRFVGDCVSVLPESELA